VKIAKIQPVRADYCDWARKGGRQSRRLIQKPVSATLGHSLFLEQIYVIPGTSKSWSKKLSLR
jgi:hypothetical protein